MRRFRQKAPLPERLPPEIQAIEDAPEQLLQLLYLRGFDTPQKILNYLHPDASQLYDPFLMKDMEKAVELIREAVRDQLPITIFGDYDVDGVSATAILLTYLRKQRACVDYYIPDRHGEGYGLNLNAVHRIAEHSKLLITVDCGIACVEEVRAARELGMRVIVTDHHQIGPKIPECEAVLNPLLGNYPFRRLCGAGVAFKLVQALGGTEAIEGLWELAALATVADIVPLVDENRILVVEGLKRIETTKRPGLLALMQVVGIEGKLTSSDIAFRLAPRINAGGRLALAGRSVEMLTTRNEETARTIAEELNTHNEKRKELEMDIFRQADERIPREIDFRKDRAIVICGKDWETGVLGLVASRLVEKYHWPSIVLSSDGEKCVGSARSIPGVNIFEALSQCADLFVRFGGHSQAAGLTILESDMPKLKRKLSDAIRAISTFDDFIPTAEYDLEINPDVLTEEFAEAFSVMQPTGYDNILPEFYMSGVRPVDASGVGKDNAHLRLRLAGESTSVSAIGFRMGDWAAKIPEKVDVTFGLTINEWQGRREVQCELHKIGATFPQVAFQNICRKQEITILHDLLEKMKWQRHGQMDVKPQLFDLVWMKLNPEMRKEPQGYVLVLHTGTAMTQKSNVAPIALLLQGLSINYALRAPEDIQCFNSLVIAPDYDAFPYEPDHIVLLDGIFLPDEVAGIKKRFPNTQVTVVSGLRPSREEFCRKVLLEDKALGEFYRALRRMSGIQMTLSVLAKESGITTEQALCSLMIFEELGLLSFQLEPFSYSLLSKSGKTSLENSRLRAALQ